MRSNIKNIVLILAGVTAGIILYAYFGHPAGENGSINDSLFVEKAYAGAQQLDEANEDINQSRRNIITRAVEKISPGVVSINVMQVKEYVRRSPFRDPILRQFFPELFRDRTYRYDVKSMGSGFIISSDGYILTNDHVVEDAREIKVTLFGGKHFDAGIVGTDKTSDIALLKIDADEPLPYLVPGNSDDVIIGEWAIAVGNPFGLFEINNRPTVTVGVISAVDRDFGPLGNERVYQDMIQTDASINHGNSGGPLCNALGEVIGMNTFIYTGSQNDEGSVGIGFAIPMKRILRIVDDLKKYHKVDRDFWIGIKVQNLNSVIARKLGYSSTNGVLVTHIDRGSPADKAGLKLGDIIIRMQDSPVNSDRDVFEIIYGSDLKVGDNLDLVLWRDGETVKTTLFLESMQG